MTVRELIEKLQTFDQELEVKLLIEDQTVEIEDIEVSVLISPGKAVFIS